MSENDYNFGKKRGRPKKYKPKNIVFTTRITEETASKLDYLIENSDKSMSDFFADLIDKAWVDDLSQ